jgi:hypothetical protein
VKILEEKNKYRSGSSSSRVVFFSPIWRDILKIIAEAHRERRNLFCDSCVVFFFSFESFL